MFWNRKKKEDKLNIEEKADGQKVLIREGEKSGQDSVELLEFAAKQNGFPVFKGEVKHAYESDYLKYKDKCPRCQTATVQMMSNFAYATQEAARLSTSHAGHFCPNCPTVIIDDDVMRNSISDRFRYGGVTSIETGYTDKPSLFETLNGEKTVYILDEYHTGVVGISQSVNLIDEDSFYIGSDGTFLGSSPRKKKQNSRLRKRNMSAKKMRRKR